MMRFLNQFLFFLRPTPSKLCDKCKSPWSSLVWFESLDAVYSKHMCYSCLETFRKQSAAHLESIRELATDTEGLAK